MWFKKTAAALGDFEQLVLLGVLRLGDEAYGAAIRQEIHTRSGRDVSINAVYTTLDRLERKGLLRSASRRPSAAAGGASSTRCGRPGSRHCGTLITRSRRWPKGWRIAWNPNEDSSASPG